MISPRSSLAAKERSPRYFSAELKISPLPRDKGLGLIFFASVGEAMQATVELLDLKPAAIEHIDRPLLDQTKGQLHFQAARDLLELDTKPCESILIVEFYDDVAERLSILQARKLGLRTKILTDSGADEFGLVGAQIWPLAFDRLRRASKTGRVH